MEQSTWPLVMVSRGPAERPLVEYFLDHWSALRPYWLPLLELHGPTFLEVTAMKEQTFEEMSVEDEKKYAELLVQFVGGEKRLVQVLDDERLMRALIQKLGAEQAQRLMQQLAEEASRSTDQH